MTLQELLTDLEYELQTADGQAVPKDSERGRKLLSREISDITNDSRKAEAGMLFFAIRGANSDGHDYAAQVAEQGAAAVKDSIDCLKEGGRLCIITFHSLEDRAVKQAYMDAVR